MLWIVEGIRKVRESARVESRGYLCGNKKLADVVEFNGVAAVGVLELLVAFHITKVPHGSLCSPSIHFNSTQPLIPASHPASSAMRLLFLQKPILLPFTASVGSRGVPGRNRHLRPSGSSLIHVAKLHIFG